jgi:hypothetical protein
VSHIQFVLWSRVLTTCVHAHAALVELALEHGLEARDIGVVIDQGGDLEVSRCIRGLQIDVPTETAWVVA